MNGFIYVFSNPSQKGLIKIGKSQSDPQSLRKDELYTTGVPEPFNVEYIAFVEDFHTVEGLVHNKLNDFRPNKKREFFTCSIPHAILTIQQIARIKFEEVFYQSPEEIKKEQDRQLEEQEKQQRLEEARKKEEDRKLREKEVERQKELERNRREQQQKIDNLKTELVNGVIGSINFIAKLVVIWGAIYSYG